MKSAAGDVVVIIKGKDLSFVGVAIVDGQMQYLLDVADKGGAPEIGLVVGGVTAECCGVGGAVGIDPSGLPVCENAGLQLVTQTVVYKLFCHNCYLLSGDGIITLLYHEP